MIPQPRGAMRPIGSAVKQNILDTRIDKLPAGKSNGWNGFKEAMMRIPALAILTSVTVLTAAPARAQTYNPDYPVCLQVYDIEGSYIECGYTSLPQCAQTASGRAAQCIVNPYFASTQVRAARYYRRHHHVY